MTGGPEEVPALAGPTRTTELPATARGLRTRAALVDAARVVFERDGFVGSRLTDITKEAGMATGTFYTYFPSKDEIFKAVLELVQDEMLHPGFPHVADDDPIAVIEASNRAYLMAYQRNRLLNRLMHEVQWINPEFMELRQERARRFAERNARSIADLQKRGLVDPFLDPLMTARALSSMVSRLALDSLVFDVDDVELVLETVNRLWVNALGLKRA